MTLQKLRSMFLTALSFCFSKDDLTRSSVSSDEDGPLSSEKLRQLAEKNSEQVEEVVSAAQPRVSFIRQS
jgi:hypothetical protein